MELQRREKAKNLKITYGKEVSTPFKFPDIKLAALAVVPSNDPILY